MLLDLVKVSHGVVVSVCVGEYSRENEGTLDTRTVFLDVFKVMCFMCEVVLYILIMCIVGIKS